MFSSLEEKSEVEPRKSMKEDAISKSFKHQEVINYGSLQKYVNAAGFSIHT